MICVSDYTDIRGLENDLRLKLNCT